MNPRSQNFLTSFVNWFQQTVLGKKPKATALKEVFEQTLTESDFFEHQKYLGMLNKLQLVRSADPWAIAMWKATPLTTDHAFFYYLVCFEIPYTGKSTTSIILSTGVRRFNLKRGQGKSWGKHQIQVMKAERQSDQWEILYSRNSSFLNAKLSSQPSLNAAIAMRILARRLLTVSLRKLDWDGWDHQVNVAIAGWGELEPRSPSDNKDYWKLDKK
ncbi:MULTISPECIES: hypothetical protein [Trichocoleus]|uniref:Uncharacterized protein n=1 Tax=Trichocoleus desertorum GB2-A4 TaxID=2933944 RepID=A0ABV0JCY2_9CYAN|nr:hypothetical protein [Trichocoleus sp. FACHB-46]MBD1864276.1 hypothetical protein [Trichocoleus sp. FACHB-46]